MNYRCFATASAAAAEHSLAAIGVLQAAKSLAATGVLQAAAAEHSLAATGVRQASKSLAATGVPELVELRTAPKDVRTPAAEWLAAKTFRECVESVRNLALKALPVAAATLPEASIVRAVLQVATKPAPVRTAALALPAETLVLVRMYVLAATAASAPVGMYVLAGTAGLLALLVGTAAMVVPAEMLVLVGMYVLAGTAAMVVPAAKHVLVGTHVLEGTAALVVLAAKHALEPDEA